jgi:hypothetical protein
MLSSASHYGSEIKPPKRVRSQDIHPTSQPRQPPDEKPLPPLPNSPAVNIPEGQSDIITLAQPTNQDSEKMVNTILQVLGKNKKQEDGENNIKDKPLTPYEKERSFEAKELGVIFPHRDIVEESEHTSISLDTTVYTTAFQGETGETVVPSLPRRDWRNRSTQQSTTTLVKPQPTV